MRIAISRPLTPNEHDSLEWLVLNGSEDSQTFALQLAGVSVCGTCTCGCPTIDLIDEESFGSLPSRISLLADVVAKVNGVDVGVLLFQKNGRLSMLQVYAFGDPPRPFGLSEIADIFGWEQLSKRREKGLRSVVNKD